MSTSENNWAPLVPPFVNVRTVWGKFKEFVLSLMRTDPNDPSADAAVETIRRNAFAAPVHVDHKSSFDVVVSVLCDLRLQGWVFTIDRRTVRLQRPLAELNPELERMRIRRMHAVNRNAQLLRGSVRSFVRDLERKRLGPSGWISIFSLMRDGRELAGKLRKISRLPKSSDPLHELRGVIAPYIQVVGENQICEHTGLRLADVWRYFRHTWASEAQTVPGRNLMILVRDAAAKNHPVIGLAALTSPVVHLTLRDEWIGWAPQKFVDELRANPTTEWAKWVSTQLASSLKDIYIDDLIRERIISRSDLASPSEDAIASLEEQGEITLKLHRLHPTKELHKTPSKDLDDAGWQRRAETHLFRSKRCLGLASLLRAKLRLIHAGFDRPNKESLKRALSTSEGRQAVEVIRKHVKAIHVGNDVLDISVCGAIAPYSDVIGGKLVAMLLTSPELVQAYSQRYGKANSIIASSMAGRRVSRRPRLTTMTTTSLYGTNLNQYTRLRVEVSDPKGGLPREVSFKKLGATRGQGSFHFSVATVDQIEAFLSQSADSRTVNSIFGEGVSPRLRKIRNGLDASGFPSDFVLTHGSPRAVYGISLTSNQRDYLLGLAKTPNYLFPQKSASQVTHEIADYWKRRWLLPRIQRPEVLDRVERHTLVSPVEHAARVQLMRIPDEEPLFSRIPEE
jgi:hypothetical protein